LLGSGAAGVQFPIGVQRIAPDDRRPRTLEGYHCPAVFVGSAGIGGVRYRILDNVGGVLGALVHPHQRRIHPVVVLRRAVYPHFAAVHAALNRVRYGGFGYVAVRVEQEEVRLAVKAAMTVDKIFPLVAGRVRYPDSEGQLPNLGMVGSRDRRNRIVRDIDVNFGRLDRVDERRRIVDNDLILPTVQTAAEVVGPCLTFDQTRIKERG